ncbi:MAG: hypothetical protein IPM82_03875 [Saprospiraceae bacterium]|nr:hypothetical protein [Saprospiraceae bacterium]
MAYAKMLTVPKWTPTRLAKQLLKRDAELARIKKEIKDAFGLGSDVAVTNQNGEMVVTLAEPVNYASGSAKLNRQSRKSVEALAKTLKNNPSMHLLIEGHADSDKYPGKWLQQLGPQR